MELRFGLVLVAFLAAGCSAHRASSSSPDQVSAISEALVGDWAAPADHGVFMRFTADGKVAVAQAREDLDHAKTTGSWAMENSRLTFTNLTGSCADTDENKVGVYDVQVNGDAVHFAKVQDACDRRSMIDGETWARLH